MGTNKLLRADVFRVLYLRSNASFDLWRDVPASMRSLSRAATGSTRVRLTPVTVLIAIRILLPAAALSQPVVYVTNSHSSTVSVLDLWANKVTASIPVGRFPIALSTSRDGSVLYVGNNYSRTLSVIDGRMRQAVAEILVDGSPSDVAAASDGAVAYVALSGKGKIPIVSAATSGVVGSVTVASEVNKLRQRRNDSGRAT